MLIYCQLEPEEQTSVKNINENTNIFFQENAFENVVCKMFAILFRPHCMKCVLIMQSIVPLCRESHHVCSVLWGLFCHYNYSPPPPGYESINWLERQINGCHCQRRVQHFEMDVFSMDWKLLEACFFSFIPEITDSKKINHNTCISLVNIVAIR